MKLIATKPLCYGGLDLLPGNEFEAADHHGRTLIAIGKASLPSQPDKPLAPSVVPAAGKKKGNGYRTRRLKAGD